MLKKIDIKLLLCMAVFCPTVIGVNAVAQTPPIQNLPPQNPNQDRFPQPIPKLEPLPNTKPELKPTPPPEPNIAPSSVQIPVQKIEVVGATLLKPSEIRRITQPVEGKSITLTELQGVANAITQLYLNQGYITSRAIVGQQSIVNGIVQIQVIEGSIEKIEVQGLERLKSAYVRDRLQLGVGKPFNQIALEDQLRLLKSDPLLADLEASLRPGTGAGQSILTVRVKESNSLAGFVGIDNSSSFSTGAERFGGGVSYRNVTGLGDQLSASYFRSFQGGSNAFDFNYRLPVNPMNGTVELRYAPNRSKITDPQFPLGIRSDSDLYEISYRQPLIRSTREEFALSLGLAFQDGQILIENLPAQTIGNSDANGNSRTRVLKFGQDYLSRDERGAWAFRSQLNFGLNIGNATINASPTPSGQFFSWVGQVQRAQQLSPNQLLIAQADVQLTPDSLLPFQQFIIGGGQSIRGYGQNARSGDNGFRVSVEDRIALQKDGSGIPTLQLVPFIDAGTVWNRSDNPNNAFLPGKRFLSSIGVGAIYQPFPQLNLRVDYAIPFLKLDGPNESARNQTLSFSAGYSF